MIPRQTSKRLGLAMLASLIAAAGTVEAAPLQRRQSLTANTAGASIGGPVHRPAATIGGPAAPHPGAVGGATLRVGASPAGSAPKPKASTPSTPSSTGNAQRTAQSGGVRP